MFSSSPLSYTGSLVRQYDRDRFLTCLFAPPRMRARLFALYAFNVEVARIRETVSEPIIGQMRLQWWRDVICGLEEGQSPPMGHPVAESLADVAQDTDLSFDLLRAVLDARERDLEESLAPSLPELLQYCRNSSAVLSVLALECLGILDAVTKEAAEAAGIGWALTGLARSVRHNALSGRVVLPSDMMSDAGLSLHKLQNPENSDTAASLIRTICLEARAHLEASRGLSNQVDLKGLPVLLPVTLASHYLQGMEKTRYDMYHPDLRRQRPALVRLCWNAWTKKY